MEQGEFHCPKCSQLGMGNYKRYESKILNDGQKHWIIYNVETEPGGWLCWALLYECGVDVKHWWDPWGCCFNPCTAGTTVTVYENGYGDRYVETNHVCTICCCFLFFIICYFLYAIYLCLFIWYDIYHAFCNGKSVKIICIGNGEKKVDDNDKHWNDITDYTFTENWWKNYPNLFVCSKCAFRGNSLKDFVGPVKQNIEVVYSQRDVLNTGANSNI